MFWSDFAHTFRSRSEKTMVVESSPFPPFPPSEGVLVVESSPFPPLSTVPLVPALLRISAATGKVAGALVATRFFGRSCRTRLLTTVSWWGEDRNVLIPSSDLAAKLVSSIGAASALVWATYLWRTWTLRTLSRSSLWHLPQPWGGLHWRESSLWWLMEIKHKSIDWSERSLL